jgi:hypothetical protein
MVSGIVTFTIIPIQFYQSSRRTLVICSDIRSQIQDQRCEILQRQLSGTPEGDYQLQKAG